MASFNVSISEGSGGYVGSSYVSSGYVAAQTSMGASISSQLAASRTISSTVTLTDTIANLDIGRAITQTVNAIHSVSRQLSAFRELTSSSGGYVDTGYTASGYLVDNLTTITDNINRVRDVPVALSQTITNTNAVVRMAAFSRSVSESITSSETLARLYAALRTITPTVTLTDTLARAATFSRSISQSISFSEILSGIKGIPGTGASRIRETTAFVLKRSGITRIYKRSATTSS